MARRRMQPLLAAATVSEGRPKFAPDWPAVECALGRALDDGARLRIIEIVDRYLDEERFERAAPNLTETVDWGRGVRHDALTLYRSLLGATRPADITLEWQRQRDGQDRILSQIEIAAAQHRVYREKYQHLLPFLLWLARQLGEGVRAIEADAPAGFAEGKAWREMIYSLAGLAKEYGISTGVSNTNNALNPAPARFKEFIDELQAYMGDRARHLGPNGTSPAAIREALRGGD